MKKERNIAQEILAGIQEIAEWQQGKKKLKVTRVDMPEARDVAKIRKKLNLDQEDFADLMGVSVRTLQNWEQKRREPQGAAKSLLCVAEKDPGAVLKALPRSSAHARKHHPTKTIKKSSRSK